MQLNPIEARSSSPRPFWKKLSWNRPQDQLHGDPVAHLATLQKSRSRGDFSSVSPPRRTAATLPALFGAVPSVPTASTEALDQTSLGESVRDSRAFPLFVHDMPEPPLSQLLLQYLTKSTSSASMQTLGPSLEILASERPESNAKRRLNGKLPALEVKNEERKRPSEENQMLRTRAHDQARAKIQKGGTEEDGPKTPASKMHDGRIARHRSPNKTTSAASQSRSAVKRPASKRGPKLVNRRITVTEDYEEIHITADDDELQEEPVVGIRERSASNFVGHKKRRSTAVEYKNEFQYLLALMRRHNISIDELRVKRAEFNAHDSGGCGVIAKAEFHQLVRKRCGYLPHESIPEHLVADTWLDETGLWMDFEGYLLWSLSTAYSEEFMVSDPKERHLRQVARTNQITDYLYVEKVKHVFDSFDEDHSDHIDESEFEKVIYVLMNARHPSDISPQMLKRFWREVDTDGSGEITFEEFLLWYFKFMGEPQSVQKAEQGRSPRKR